MAIFPKRDVTEMALVSHFQILFTEFIYVKYLPTPWNGAWKGASDKAFTHTRTTPRHLQKIILFYVCIYLVSLINLNPELYYPGHPLTYNHIN